MPEIARFDDVPAEVWNGVDYTSVRAVVLFASLDNSILLSGALHPNEYQKLINEFQSWMMNQLWQLEEQQLHIGEYYIAGDRLSLYLYDRSEVARNYLLDGPNALRGDDRTAVIKDTRRVHAELLFNGLKAAIALKNAWLAEKSNLPRLRSQLDIHGLGIGLHTGQVHLCNRADGRKRIEGHAIEFGKRIAKLASHGKFSRIMLSQEAHDRIRSAVRKHTMLRQRIFFHEHQAELELLPGMLQPHRVFELKFFSRIGIALPKDVIDLYEKLFITDRSDAWAYYQLFEYYAYQELNWDKVFELAKEALLIHPGDEKVMLDMSRCYLRKGSMDQAQRFAEMALEVNPEFDLVYEHLAVMANERGDIAAQRLYCSKALSLTPGSPICHLNLGFVLCECGALDEAAIHLIEAFEVYPEYLHDSATLRNLATVRDSGNLPPRMLDYLSSHGVVLPPTPDAGSNTAAQPTVAAPRARAH